MSFGSKLMLVEASERGRVRIVVESKIGINISELILRCFCITAQLVGLLSYELLLWQPGNCRQTILLQGLVVGLFSRGRSARPGQAGQVAVVNLKHYISELETLSLGVRDCQ